MTNTTHGYWGKTPGREVSMYKTQAEVEAALAETYSGPIFQREGAGGRTFDYIPWTETVRLLNTVFGPFGWTTSQPIVSYNEGVYTVTLALTVTVTEAEGDYNTITKTVPGVGQAVSRGANDDNAAKSALSDAISRAAKLLGDAFGFGLYEKKPGQGQRSSTSTTPQVTHGDLGFRPSAKQEAMLRKNNIPFETMTGPEWKAALDEVFAKLKAREPVELTF